MVGPEDTAAALARNLRRLRAERGLTLDELARRAGISRSMLIQIEQKRVNPTLAILVRLAQALDIGLAELVEVGSRQRVRVVPCDEVAELWTSPGGGSGRLLVGSDQLDHIELWDWGLGPGDVPTGPKRTWRGQWRSFTCSTAASRSGSTASRHAAAAGESVVFSADADHAYANRETSPLHVVMIVITPPAAKPITPGGDPRFGGAR